MKKISAISLMLAQILVFANSDAQSIVPAQTSTIPVARPQSMTPAQSANAEAQGYSIAFLAYHYNQQCQLGLSKEIIDSLLTELSRSEKVNKMSQADIAKNAAEAQRIYNENPQKFCDDARKIAGTIRALFGGQRAQ